MSTDCQPIVNHTLRIVNIRRLFFAFFVSNPTIFRVPHFKSDHFAGFGGFSQLTAGFWWVFAAYGWVFRLACWVFLPYGWVFRLRNDKVNSLLLLGNRTKVTENIPLFGGPYRNSHRQFFHSPIRRAWSICTTLHLQVKSFLKVHSSGAHGCKVQINGCAPGTTVDLNVYLKV